MKIIRRRGKCKEPTKGHFAASGVYKLGDQQKFNINAKKREKRLRETVKKRDIIINNLRNTQTELQDFIATNRIQLVPDKERSFSPLSIAVMQIEQDSYSVNYGVVEKFRSIDAPINAPLYTKKSIPSRSTVQRTRLAIAKGGESFTAPVLSKQHDIVTLNERAIIEELLRVSAWDGCDISEDGTVSEEAYAALPALQISGTADGAKLGYDSNSALNRFEMYIYSSYNLKKLKKSKMISCYYHFYYVQALNVMHNLNLRTDLQNIGTRIVSNRYSLISNGNQNKMKSLKASHFKEGWCNRK